MQTLGTPKELRILPRSMQLQLTIQSNRRLFSAVTLFKNLDPKLVCFWLQLMRPMIALPNEMINLVHSEYELPHDDMVKFEKRMFETRR